MRETSISAFATSRLPNISARRNSSWFRSVIADLDSFLGPRERRSVVPACRGVTRPVVLAETRPRHARQRREDGEIGGDVEVDGLKRLFEHHEPPADLARLEPRRLTPDLGLVIAVREALARQPGLGAE